MTPFVQNRRRVARHQRGAALAVGLILLLVLTVLAVSGVVTSTFQLRSVANQQQQERAFQAAEVGIERALTQPLASTAAPTVVARTPVDATNTSADRDEFAYEIRPLGESPPPSSAPSSAVSAGIGLAAFHFEVTSEGFAPGEAQAEHTQGFYVIVNTGGTTLPSTGIP